MPSVPGMLSTLTGQSHLSGLSIATDTQGGEGLGLLLGIGIANGGDGGILLVPDFLRISANQASSFALGLASVILIFFI